MSLICLKAYSPIFDQKSSIHTSKTQSKLPTIKPNQPMNKIVSTTLQSPIRLLLQEFSRSSPPSILKPPILCPCFHPQFSHQLQVQTPSLSLSLRNSMGTLVGHVAPGIGFLLIGVWHLYNHIKLFSINPNTYRSLPWFPFPKLRHLELILIAAGSAASIAMELFIGPQRHQPLDNDLSIPSYHLHNFEHASISLTFFLYAVSATALDRARPARPGAEPLTVLAAATAFAQQILLFHLHSADHMGVEGQYHWLLQLVVAVSLSTTLLGISHPCSFAVGFLRSASIAMQGLWFVVMGYALWTPALIPKGCFMNAEDGHYVVRCRSNEALHRAKSLANIEFSWLLAAVIAASLLYYFFFSKRYAEEPEYVCISKAGGGEEEVQDLEFGKKSNGKLEDSDSFVHMGTGMRFIELER